MSVPLVYITIEGISLAVPIGVCDHLAFAVSIQLTTVTMVDAGALHPTDCRVRMVDAGALHPTDCRVRMVDAGASGYRNRPSTL